MAEDGWVAFDLNDRARTTSRPAAVPLPTPRCGRPARAPTALLDGARRTDAAQFSGAVARVGPFVGRFSVIVRTHRAHGMPASTFSSAIRACAAAGTAPHEHEHGSGHFADDECAPKAPAASGRAAARATSDWIIERPVDCHAGASPNSQAGEQRGRRRRTAGFVRRSASVTALGSRPGGTIAARPRRIAAPMPAPRAPPSDRQHEALGQQLRDDAAPGPAPSADRTASSRARAFVRARSRLAMFAQHMSSTKPTTPSRSSDVTRISRADQRLAQRLASSGRAPGSCRGNSFAFCAPIAVRSCCAASSVTPA